MVVERIGPGGDARLHFALADASTGRSGLGQFVRVLDGAFDRDELAVDFQDRGIVHALRLRLRSGDVMEAVFERTADRTFRAAGVLLRDGAAPPIPPFDGRWPEGIEALRADASTAAAKARLPHAARGASAAPDPARAAWSGDWSGWMCARRACDFRVAVRDVTAVSATVHWAMAADGEDGAARTASGTVPARFDRDELDASFADGPTPTRLRFRQRGPDELEALIDGTVRGTPLRAWGVMTRDR